MSKITDTIIEAGFPYTKYELEANLSRGDSGEDDEPEYIECENCGGSGHLTFTDDNDNDYEVDCAECQGEGEVENERYNRCDYTVEYCHKYIMEYLRDKGLAEYRSNDTFRLGHAHEVGSQYQDSHWHPVAPLKYLEFYYDGSVDSEVTFTCETGATDCALSVIEAFNSLAEQIGNEVDVRRAGMHISLLTSSDYSYRGDDKLDPRKIENFRREVTRLLPALFVTAMSGDFTRSLTPFRAPQVSRDDKYSAIFTHYDTCIEYRLFETCYQRPEAIYEFLGAIAKTLAYYTDPTLKVTQLDKEYQFFNHSTCDTFTRTPEQISVVSKLLQEVIPEGYTLAQITKDRKIDLSLSVARAKEANRQAELHEAYLQYVDSYERQMALTLQSYQQERYERLCREHPENGERENRRIALGMDRMDTEEEYYRYHDNHMHNSIATITV